MKKGLALFVLALVGLCFTATVHPANPVKVDVLYMNHGPLMDTLNKMKTVFAAYGTRVNVSWHDLDTREGGQFMARKGIKQHVPLIIWIDDKSTCAVGVKQVTFNGFPTGSGPAFFQGKWTLDDLKAALNQATGQK